MASVTASNPLASPTLPTRVQNLRYHLNPLNRHGDLCKRVGTLAFWAFTFKSSEQLVRDWHTYSFSYISEAFSHSAKGASLDGLRHLVAKYVVPSAWYAASWVFVGACVIGALIALRTMLLPDRQTTNKLSQLTADITSKEQLLKAHIESALSTKPSSPDSAPALEASQPQQTPLPETWTALIDQLGSNPGDKDASAPAAGTGNPELVKETVQSLLRDLFELYKERCALCRIESPEELMTLGAFMDSNPALFLEPQDTEA